MIQRILSTLDYFSPANEAETSDFLDRIKVRFRIAVVVFGSFTGLLSSILEGVKFGFLAPINLVNIAWIISFTIALILIKRGTKEVYPNVLMVTSVITAIFCTAYYLDGLDDPVFTWLNFGPLLAILIGNKKFVVYVSVLIFFEMGLFLHFYDYSAQIQNDLDFYVKIFGIMTPILFSGIFAFAFSLVIDHTHNKLVLVQQQLLAEKQKTFHSQKLNSLGEMAAGIAHEINNPLLVVHGQINLAKRRLEKGDTSKLAAQLSKVAVNIDRITNIIKSLRSISFGSEFDKAQEIDLTEVVEDVINIQTNRAKNANVDLSFKAGHGDTLVFAEKSSISQVVLNLISNSLDEMEQIELDSKWIKVESYLEDDSVCLSIIDAGKGIPEDLRDKIMDPFFSTRDIGGGTGLGLSISSSIMQNNNGTLKLDIDCPNTKFVLRFNLKNPGQKSA